MKYLEFFCKEELPFHSFSPSLPFPPSLPSICLSVYLNIYLPFVPQYPGAAVIYNNYIIYHLLQEV